MFKRIFRDRRVLVTGHTGFKGSWLVAWLASLDARVSGLALDPNEDQRLFGELNLAKRLKSDHRVDVRDAAMVARIVEHVGPEFIFHLAAQPLVRRSYDEPLETFGTNVMGTANVLDAVRQAGRSCVVVVATSDKCYDNREDATAYAEQDRLGGRDPYSASKACAELVAAAYRASFFTGDLDVRLATARAGNVIGGGDWSRDRIVPDAIRAVRLRQAVQVRNQSATRPWQHVLEPLSGYLWLAAALERPEFAKQSSPTPLCEAFNFGPTEVNNRTVAELVDEVLEYVPGTWVDASEADAPHEARKLNLAIDKSRDVLGWRPLWHFGETVRETVSWYQSVANGKDPLRTTMDQIHHYQAAAHEAGIAWAV